MNDKIKRNMTDIIGGIVNSYAEHPVAETEFKLPNKDTIIYLTEELRDLMFPGYFNGKWPNPQTLPYYIGTILQSVEEKLFDQVRLVLGGKDSSALAEDICFKFFKSLPEVREYLAADVTAAIEGDPAATDKAQIISSYPGVFAISVYRLAHEFFKLGVPYIPRIMTEYAHSKTGIDIHPSARIGKSFFIDHGTGVVIGETCVIGANVKLYQGVTLGALSTKDVKRLKCVKRHPTIEDNVTVYSGATVLGGETVIGEGAVIGGNTFITKSVEPNTYVSIKNIEHEYRNRPL